MPTGTYSAGVEPAGFDPVPAYSPKRDVSPAAGLHFDGRSKSFVLLDSGLIEALHPVDQQMAYGLLFEKGSLASAPDVGHTFRQIASLASPSLQRDVEERINESQPIARLLSSGWVEILDVKPYTVSGRLYVTVYYRNLLIDPKRESLPSSTTSS